MMKRLLVLVCLVPLIAAGCIYYNGPAPTTQTPGATQGGQTEGPPTIAAFTAVPATVNQGSSATLLWTVANATSVSIDNNVGTVPQAGTTTVTPAGTTIYTMNATNAYGTTTATAVITVTATTTAPPTSYPYPQPPQNPYPGGYGGYGGNPYPPSPSSSSFAITGVVVSVDNPTYSGTCPKTLTFTATITANGPGSATYGWERSDGALGLNQTIVFPAAGSQSVTETWELGASYTGWEQVHIYSPNNLISNQAGFKLTCGYGVTGVSASTTTPVVTGACPKTIAFSGLITVSGGPMTVTYRWERSDGASGPTQTLFFGAASAQTVTETWQLGATYSGWERLHVLAPNDMVSNQAPFSLTCF